MDPHGVFGRVLDQPYVTVTGGQFYVTWQNQATRTFGTGSISSPQAAGGSLWALLAARQETLLRMNPVTLAVTGTLPISSGQYLSSYGNHLSVAGGALWAVAGNRLVRVSLRTGKAEKVVDLRGGFSTSMAGSPSGSFLIVSVADSGGRGSLQRRDPVSGALLASRATGGVVAADGLAWVLRAGPEAGGNYCADPVTGKKLAVIPLPHPAQDDVTGIWGRYVYYAAPAGLGDGTHLTRVAVPAACRVG